MVIKFINDIIVTDGKITLSDLPIPDGHHVRILITDYDDHKNERSIEEVRKLLGGTILKFDDPSEPMIPPETWEMQKCLFSILTSGFGGSKIIPV